MRYMIHRRFANPPFLVAPIIDVRDPGGNPVNARPRYNPVSRHVNTSYSPVVTPSVAMTVLAKLALHPRQQVELPVMRCTIIPNHPRE